MDDINLFSSKSFPLSNLLVEIDNGNIALPELQRPFVWKLSQIRDLFDSLYAGYPAGFILLWEMQGASEKSRMVGINKKQRGPRLLIIDGQQRLTSLYSIFKNKKIYNNQFKEIKPKIAFHPLEEKFEVADASTEKDIYWINDITEFFNSFTHKYINNYIQKLREKIDLDPKEEQKIAESMGRLDKIKSYPFTVLELSSELDVERVSEVFVRVNSKGKSLNQSDFIMTVLSVYASKLREEIERFAAEAKKIPEQNRPSPYNNIFLPQTDHLVRIMVADAFSRGRLKYAHPLLKGRDLEKETESPEIRKKNLKKAEKAIEKALDLKNWHDYIKILKSIGIVDSSLISSGVMMSFVYALYLHTKEVGLDIKESEKFVGAWMFMAILTRRYSGSFESTFERDLQILKKKKDKNYFIETYSKIVESNLTEDLWSVRLPNEILISSSSKNPGYIAYLMTLSMRNTNVLFSSVSLKDVLGGNETYQKNILDRHHLFPVNYLKKKGIRNFKDINQVANYCYIEYPVNIQISDKAPSEYFPKLMKKYGDSVTKKDLKNHALPSEFWKMNYKQFLEERRKLMAQVIKKGVKKFIR